jgi:hypothetical protein
MAPWVKTGGLGLVILREVAGSMRRLDSATSLRYAQNDRRGFSAYL